MNFFTLALLPFSWLVFCSASLNNGCTDLEGNARAEYKSLIATMARNIQSISKCIVPYKSGGDSKYEDYKNCICALNLPKRLEKHFLNIMPSNSSNVFTDVPLSVCLELKNESSRPSLRPPQNQFTTSAKASDRILLIIGGLAVILVIFGISYGIYLCAARSKVKESIENPPETPYVGMNLK